MHWLLEKVATCPNRRFIKPRRDSTWRNLTLSRVFNHSWRSFISVRRMALFNSYFLETIAVSLPVLWRVTNKRNCAKFDRGEKLELSGFRLPSRERQWRSSLQMSVLISVKYNALHYMGTLNTFRYYRGSFTYGLSWVNFSRPRELACHQLQSLANAVTPLYCLFLLRSRQRSLLQIAQELNRTCEALYATNTVHSKTSLWS